MVEESNYLISDYTIKIQSSRQYGIGKYIYIYTPIGLDRKPGDKPMHIWAPYLWQRRKEYMMGKKTASSISSAGRTGQLHVKEWN